MKIVRGLFGRNGSKTLKVLTWILAVMIVFTTTYALILPAITIDQATADNEPGMEFADEEPGEAGSGEQLIDDATEFAEAILEEIAETVTPTDTDEQPEAAEDPEEGDTAAETEAEKTSDDAPETEVQTGTDEQTVPTASNMPAVTFTGETHKTYPDNVKVTVTAPEGAFPAGSFMVVRNVTDVDSKVETSVKDAVEKSDKAEGEVKTMQVIDITFFNEDGQEIEPLKEIKVRFEADSIKTIEEPVLVHIPDEGKGEAKVVDQLNEQEAELEGKKDNEIIFKSDDFSMYVIVETESITVTYMTADGSTYEVTVTCDSEAGIPEGSQLEVSELTSDDEEYDSLVEQTAEKVNLEVSELSYIRLLDISIVDKDGSKVTPDAPVDVQIRLIDRDTIGQSAQVVHFGEEIEILDSSVNGDTVSFETNGFSAYAIVEGPSAGGEDWGWEKVANLDEFIQYASSGLIVGHSDGFYFTDETYNVNNTSRTGIKKTERPGQDYPRDTAKPYYFEEDTNNPGRYYAYCIKNGVNWYVKQSSNSLSLVSSKSDATSFLISCESENVFTVENNGYYWNQQGNANGNGFAAYNQNNQGSKINFWHFVDIESEPYGLENKTYGLMNWNGGAAGKAMMASSSQTGNIDAKSLIVMNNKDDYEDRLFVPNDSDISMWTFEWVSADKYYLKADGKYLKITDTGLALADEPDDTCLVRVVPGTGEHSGQICLKSGNTTLTYTGSVDTGFSVGGSAGTEWLHLVDLSELTSDYVMKYSASKVSVSDASVTTGSKIIVYTREWNDTLKKYEFYAIDHDGTLIPCYESGDSIEWVSGRINTLLWQFTEYTNADGTPNYYYELYNQYSEKYIAPQVTDGQIVSDDTIGINLNGRREGRYYSTILAWDDDDYAYAGLKVENGQIVSCPKSQAMDFYFAIIEDIPVDDTLHTVPTVDNTKYGITMKIVDINDTVIKPDNADTTQIQHAVMGDSTFRQWVATQGLLTRELGADGYPVAVNSGRSLADLFGAAYEVNHLFIESTYRASGYYEYNSAQNFASLHGTDFVVYKELASYDTAGNKPTLKHGQFFPFNDIEAGVFTSVNKLNQYTVTGSELPDSDPRKNEQLYLIKNTDCFYGVELEATFTQTPNGEDDWGHDIIFEFTGDDDFWLYVDGELVIDLGGIHSALPGSVNFKTGEVKVNGVTKTLRQIFEENYRAQHPNATDQEVKDWLENEKGFAPGSDIFAEYTTHTMKIFYMERGGGAANLQMRFNLASVRPGTVELSKKLDGIDSSESTLAEFAYQIKYKKKNDDTVYYLYNHVPGTGKIDDYVFYKDTITPVTYRESLTIGGVAYNDVFILKPNETVEINFPTFGENNEEIDSYEIVECGVNTDVYRHVYVNEDEITGNPVAGTTNRKDYGIGYKSTKDRPRVKYENEVDPDALRNLTIRKKLYAEDGVTEITDDPATFSFRLYFGTESDEALALANMYTYHVKDPYGKYCTWDADNQRFVPVDAADPTDYSTFTDEQKEATSFATSINGQISKIPVSYTIEIRNILAGTMYRVEERPWEVPDGYSFREYEKDYSASIVTNSSGVDGVEDTLIYGRDSGVIVSNLKGWGMRMNKVWTDEAYMASRAPSYFAVFTEDNGVLTLVDGTVRQLAYAEDPQSIYWYFEHLPVSGKTRLTDYKIREVTISASDPTVDSDGVVTDYGTVTPIDDGEEIDLIGKQKGDEAEQLFEYTVTYEEGEVSNTNNVRIDTVTNDRPGIILKKQDWEGDWLEGAEFTLTDTSTGTVIGHFTSDENGLITIAFLRDGSTYTLKETKTPDTYHGLEELMTISSNSQIVTVNYADTDYYVLTQATEDELATLIIKNCPYTFKAVKEDGNTHDVLTGAHFQLHKQVTVDDVTIFEPEPMEGYSDLVTDSEGLIPKLDNSLPAGTYQLREKLDSNGDPLGIPGYKPLSDTLNWIQFTVSPAGKISLINNLPEVSLDQAMENGTLNYTLTVKNYINGKVQIRKQDGAGNDLPGAQFCLYLKDGSRWDPVSGYTEIDITAAANPFSISGLDAGLYKLEETSAPEGFVIRNKLTYFRISSDGGVSLTDEAGTGTNTNPDASIANNSIVITISNHIGDELPMTGGPGRSIYILSGIALIMASALIYSFRSRRRKHGRE